MNLLLILILCAMFYPVIMLVAIVIVEVAKAIIEGILRVITAALSTLLRLGR